MPSPTNLSVESLLLLLARLRPKREEVVLQASIRNVLTLEGYKHEAEVKLGKAGRIDFLVEVGGKRIGIEVKVGGASRADTERQVVRYLLSEQFDHVVLVSVADLDVRLAEIKEFAGQFTFICLAHNALL